MPGWIDSNIDFATSMVDRITPGTTDEDRRWCSGRGYVDAYPVATEPFSEWVISGAFPAGRPRWEEAGAAIVTEVEPFEQRKLWLLNGSHTMLAYAGSIRGIRQSMKPSPIRPAGPGWRCSGMRAAISPPDRRHRQLPGSTAGALLQPPGRRSAGSDSSGWINEVAGTHRADDSRRASSRTSAHRLRLHHRRLDPASARTGRSCQGLRSWPGQQAASSRELPEAVPAVLDVLEPGLGGDKNFVDAVLHQAAAIQSQ